MLNLILGILRRGLLIALLVVFGSKAQAGRPMPWLEGVESIRLKIGVSETPQCPIEKEDYYRDTITKNVVDKFALHVVESDDVDVVFYFLSSSAPTNNGECILHTVIRAEQVLEEDVLRHNNQKMNPVIVMFHESTVFISHPDDIRSKGQEGFFDFINSVYEELKGNR